MGSHNPNASLHKLLRFGAGGYYTLDVGKALRNARAAIPHAKLIVGLTEEHDNLLARVCDALNVSHRKTRTESSGATFKQAGSNGHINSDSKDFAKWGKPLKAIIAAVTHLARTNTNLTWLSQQLAATRGFAPSVSSQRLRCLWGRTFAEPETACRYVRR